MTVSEWLAFKQQMEGECEYIYMYLEDTSLIFICPQSCLRETNWLQYVIQVKQAELIKNE